MTRKPKGKAMAVQTLEKRVADRERRTEAGHEAATATIERLRKAGDNVEFAEGTGNQRLTDWPLVTLYKAGRLRRPNEGEEQNERRFATGERLYAHYYNSGMYPLGSRDYRQPYSGGGDNLGAIYPANEWREDHRLHYRNALAALGPSMAGLVVLRVVINEQSLEHAGRSCLGHANRPQAVAAAQELLLEGLDTLSRYWG